MFGFIKRLLGEPQSAVHVSESSIPTPVEIENGVPPPAVLVEQTTASVSASSPASPVKDLCLELPLQSVAVRLTPALRSRMIRSAARADVVRLPIQTALEQLPRGAVRIPFRELKEATTPGLFSGGNDFDDAPVDLPLAEILSRLKPAYWARRPEQKSLSLPEEVSSVFTSRLSPQKPSPRSHPIATPAVSSGLDAHRSSRPDGEAKFQPPAARADAPFIRPEPAPTTAEPCAGSLPGQASARLEQEPVKIPLVTLAREWPEQMRREILGTFLASSVSIPFAEFEAALKRGRASFTWKQLRSWISPKAASTLAEHDAVSLDLPLAVLTPLLLARRAGSTKPAKLVEAGDIPDVFLGRQAAKAPVADAAPSPAVAAPDRSSASRSLEHRLTESLAGIASKTNVPKPQSQPAHNGKCMDALTLARSSALPTETVQRACHLSGVAGALMATTDGLHIVSQLPPGINADVAAGFLPEVFNRLSQYTRELKLGEANQIEIQVGIVPLLVYKTPNSYLAILGKVAEPLPKIQLSGLAAQLSQRTH